MAAQRTALVTGGAKRVGLAMVEDLAKHGWAVTIHYNGSAASAQNLAQTITDGGGKAVALQADLRDISDVKALFHGCETQLAAPDVIINNASVFEPDEADRLDMAYWDAHFDVHLKAPAILAEAMAITAKPTDNRDRLIVNMIDQRVWALTPRFFSYTLSKSALWTATQTMAQAFAPLGIRVNAIGPGPTLKNIRQDDADFAAQCEAVPLGRGADLSEFGATVRYLADAKSITGQMIALDGGQHLAWETPDVTAANE